jgi:branched-subunit amino acid transport protein
VVAVTVWIAVLAVGLISYTLRAVPFLLAERIPMTPGVEAGLRHAGVGAIAALLIGSVTSPSFGGDVLPIMVALSVASVLAWMGRSMALVLTAGAVAFMVGNAFG